MKLMGWWRTGRPRRRTGNLFVESIFSQGFLELNTHSEIQDVAGKIRKSLKKAKYKGKILDLKKSKMTRIVKEAFKNTLKGGVVILSPAASSFDMFKSYKDRGYQFKDAVKRLGV